MSQNARAQSAPRPGSQPQQQPQQQQQRRQGGQGGQRAASASGPAVPIASSVGVPMAPVVAQQSGAMRPFPVSPAGTRGLPAPKRVNDGSVAGAPPQQQQQHQQGDGPRKRNRRRGKAGKPGDAPAVAGDQAQLMRLLAVASAGGAEVWGDGVGSNGDDDDEESDAAMSAVTAPAAAVVAARSGLPAAPRAATAAVAKSGAVGASTDRPSHVTDDKFSALPLSAPLQRALREKAGYEFMTVVQQQTIPVSLAGQDVLARARTGTGKTCAFLVPSIERIVTQKHGPLAVLIVSPTRELASQIAEEARKLVAFLPGIGVACVVGGSNINSEKRVLASRPHILVATPGRLLDHLNTTPGVAEMVKKLQTLVLDEADQMLEMGFRPDLLRIIQFLPPKTQRQTLLFSATVPESLHSVKQLALRDNAVYIDSIGSDDTQTNIQVEQTFAIVPFEKHIGVLEAVLRNHMAASAQYKIIVFFSTARVAGFMSELFTAAGLAVLEMHSRKSQSQRTKTADLFRAPGNTIMFSSDVSARGVDYPGITLVVQVGLPTDKQQYIHRLGRTARAGEAGQGVLLLSPWEAPFLKQLHDLPVSDFALQFPAVLATPPTARLASVMATVKSRGDLNGSAAQAYQAWLGFYNSNCKTMRWDKPTLVQFANLFARIIGLTEPPALERKTVGKMGLKGVPGLRVQ